MDVAGGLHIYARGLSRTLLLASLLLAGFTTYQRTNLPGFRRSNVIEDGVDTAEATWCASQHTGALICQVSGAATSSRMAWTPPKLPGAVVPVMQFSINSVLPCSC